MAQVPTGGNYVVDNSTGANVRADINEIFDAILTVNSGSSGPSYAKAYTLWADTNTGTMKIRNGANNAWIELFQLDGTLTLEDGTASAPALAARNDLNTGVFFSAADKFNVATGGTERMELGTTTIFNEDGADVDFRIEGDTEANLFYVDAGNNRIGIGTSTPQTLMHLNGQGARFQITNSATGSASGDGIIMGINGDNDFFINHQESSENILFFNAGSERARITHQGKVLINTSTASTVGNSQYSRFEVSGNSSNAAGAGHLTIKAGTTSASQTEGNTLGRLIFSTLDGGDYAYIQASIDGAMGNNDFPGRLMFYTCADNSSSASQRMAINSSGNVGVNMTPNSGQGILQIAGGFGIFGSASASDTATPYIFRSAGVNNMVFATGSNERMRLQSTGVLNIGSSTASSLPDRLLQIGSTSRSATFIELRTSTSGSSGIVFSDGTGNDNSGYRGTIEYFHNTDHVLFKTAAGERIRIKSDGKVAFNSGGTVNATYQFNYVPATGGIIVNTNDVFTGNSTAIQMRANGSVGGSIVLTNNGTTTAYATSSDYRLKENQVAISDGITRLKTLKPYRFNFKSSPGTTVDGFFAHEVTAVPEAITGIKDETKNVLYTEEDTIPSGKKIGDVKEVEPVYQSMDYGKITPLLTAALQEAITKIEVLETKVAALEAA